MQWAFVDRLRGRRRKSPKRAAVQVVRPDLDLLRSERPALGWMGHASFVVRMANQTVLIDPVVSTSLGPGLTRNVPCGIAVEDLHVDVICISHNHRDHLDAPSIDRIVKTQRAQGRALPRVVCGQGLAPFFEKRGLQCDALGWDDHVDVDALRIAFVPAQHWSQRTPFDQNQTLWGGFVLGAHGGRAVDDDAPFEGPTVYHSGDTAYAACFERIRRRWGAPNYALLPIGAYDPEWFMRQQHMNPADAVQAFLDLQAKTFVAMHWGTFKLTDEPLDEPPQLLQDLWDDQGLAPSRKWQLAVGETRVLMA